MSYYNRLSREDWADLTPAERRYLAALELADEFGTDVSEWLV